MPRRRHALPAAVLLLSCLASLAGRAAASVPPAPLDREGGPGYQRPHAADEGCLDAALAAQPAAAGLEGRLSFTVERDGRPTGVALAPPAGAAAEAAVRRALQSCRWVEGRDADGQPVVARVSRPVRVPAAAEPGGQARAVDRAAGPGLPPPPVALGGGSLRLDGDRAAGFRRPDLDDPACLAEALQRQKAAAGVEAKVKFAVMRDGSVSHVTMLTPAAPEVERAVEAAFQACRWRPALDPAGEPLAVWVVQPIKVAPPKPSEAQRPLFP